MSKRVILNGTNVVNVCALTGTSPAGQGQFLDVADAMSVGPGATWNGNSGAPAFAPAAAATFTDPIRFQCAVQPTDGNGQVVVVWPQAFADVPIPLSFQILDAAGGVYTVTLLANSATGLTYQVKKQRTLPTPLTLLTAIVGYDTFQPAPAGLTCYLSAKLLV